MSDAKFATPGHHDITRCVLSNGLTVLVRENHTSAAAVLRGHIRAGAVCDSDDLAGLASLTALTARRGTASRTFSEINETVESVGASLNMGAGTHTASFSGKSLGQDLSLLIEIVADILLNPAFLESELEKVRGQVVTSLRQLEDSTRHKADREFRRLCYPVGHPYARSLDGSLETVGRLQQDDLIAFYRRFYSPRGAIIAVVGDVQTDQVIARCQDALEAWQSPGDDGPYHIPSAPRPEGVKRTVVSMPNKTQADIAWGLPGLSRQSGDYYAARVADAILGQVGLMGRLGASVRDRQGLAYYASSDLEAGLGAGPWSIYAGVAPDNVERAVTGILAEVVRLRDEQVMEEELADAQDYLTGTLPLRLETNEGVAGALVDIELYALGLDYLQRYPAMIRSVTRQAVQAAAQKYLDTENYALAIAGPCQESAL